MTNLTAKSLRGCILWIVQQVRMPILHHRQLVTEDFEDNFKRILSSASNSKSFSLSDRKQLLNQVSIDYFTIFGLEKSYDIDTHSVKQRFLTLQKLLHPDKFSCRPKEEQEVSELFSSATNEAFKTLTDPYQRGIYLLKLNGFSIEEDEKGLKLEGKFLEEMIYLNEAILESDKEKLEEIKKLMQSRIDATIKQISAYFNGHDFLQAKQSLVELRFFLNILNKIRDIEE